MANERPLRISSLSSGPKKAELAARTGPNFFRNLFFKEKSHQHFDYGVHLPEVKQERSRLAKLAEQVLHELLFEPHRQNLTHEEYLKIRETIKRFYLLASPCMNPDSHPKIIEAEELTTRKHTGRDNYLGQMVWLAQENVADENRKFTRVKASEVSESEQADVERWFKANDGLIDHTFIAAEYIINLIQSIQSNLKQVQESGQKLNDLQDKFLKVDPYLYGIKMLFHDLGRLINQDRLQHELETQLILSAAGVNKIFREEPAYVDLLNMDQTESIYSMTEKEMDFMRFIFYLTDFTAKVKVNGNIRRPADFTDIISKQTKRYTGKSEKRGDGLILTAEELFDQDDYGFLEGVWLTKILFWLRDQREGLGFSIGQLRKVYKQVEKMIEPTRAELGIVD